MKILNFGSCNIDYVYSTDHIVRPGETLTTYNMQIYPGGKGLNQSIAVAKAGAKIYHAGCIGEDGQILLDIMKKSGVDISYLKTVDGKNGHAIIQVSSKGENSIFLYPGSNEKIEKDYIDAVLADFSKGDIILLQNEISNIDYIIAEAYKKGMQIVFNPSPYNGKIKKEFFGMISYIILNEVEAGEISGYEDPKKSIEYLKNTYPELKIVLTLGDKGCIFAYKDCEILSPSYKVDVVDTTAAGDTFTGYFVAGIACGDDYKKVLGMASVAAGISVSRNGAAPSIPERDEVMEQLYNLNQEVRKNINE